MRIDSKDAAQTGAAAPAEATCPPPGPPLFRMRTPDAQASTFVDGNSAKMIMADEEKLSRFLADAKLVTDQNTTPKKRLIRYQIDPEKYKNVLARRDPRKRIEGVRGGGEGFLRQGLARPQGRPSLRSFPAAEFQAARSRARTGRLSRLRHRVRAAVARPLGRGKTKGHLAFHRQARRGPPAQGRGDGGG